MADELYVVTKEDVESVANSIRLKAGTAEKISWPDGFKSTVENISSGGGGGFEYDFIIKSTDGESYTLETGTYDSIMQKLGSQPITGKVLASSGDVTRVDADCIFIGYMEAQLFAYVFSGGASQRFVINQDNTVTI